MPIRFGNEAGNRDGVASHEPLGRSGRAAYCASGVRSALAGKLLKDMGYEKVLNLGGFKDWAAAGGAVDTRA